MPVLHVDHASLSGWSPDFSSSEQASPSWTRVLVDGAELVNGLEAVQWDDNPVQLRVCESCGHTDCEAGGYAGVHRLGAHLLVGAPWVEDPDDEWDRSQHRRLRALGRAGTFLVEAPEWNRWREVARQLPAFDSLLACRRRDLAWLWINDALVVRRERPLTFEAAFEILRRQVVASDSLSPDDALGRIDALIAWALEAPELPGPASVRAASDIGANLETLYCEGGRELDWPGLAMEPRGAFAFSGGWVVSLSSARTVNASG